MKKTWLILDVSFLCHRAFHAMPELSHKGKSSGVVFGFFKTLVDLKDEFNTDRVVFCFEHKHLFRRDVYPTYKQRRHRQGAPPEEQEARKAIGIQISELQNRHLPRIGFKNIFSFRGMESDDIMAKIAQEESDEIVLVTGDSDLLQCLRSNVSIYSPIKRMRITEESFTNKYGIRPSQWAVAKAIAGCTSDEVEGIRGVGELTALRYLRGELKHTSATYHRIRSRQGLATIRRNRQLIELPYEGCPTPTLEEDEVDHDEWRKVCGLLGMKSIAGHPPIATMRRGQKK